jgi:hypothetical protein
MSILIIIKKVQAFLEGYDLKASVLGGCK